jgi:hypothetical protein
MSTGRLLAAVLVCIVAGLISIPFGLAVGGCGICAASLSPGLIGGVALVGSAFAGVVAALWRRVWWAGAVSFSLGMCLGLVYAAETARIISLILCAAATFLAAFVIRYPGPLSLRS